MNKSSQKIRPLSSQLSLGKQDSKSNSEMLPSSFNRLPIKCFRSFSSFCPRRVVFPKPLFLSFLSIELFVCDVCLSNLEFHLVPARNMDRIFLLMTVLIYFSTDSTGQLQHLPFYLYTAEDLNCSTQSEHLYHRHSAEVYFYNALVNHRWRVSDPAKAVIYVIPDFPSMVRRGKCSKELQTSLYRNVKQSRWFRASEGADHLILTTDPTVQLPSFFKNVIIARNRHVVSDKGCGIPVRI